LHRNNACRVNDAHGAPQGRASHHGDGADGAFPARSMCAPHHDKASRERGDIGSPPQSCCLLTTQPGARATRRRAAPYHARQALRPRAGI